MFSNRNKIRNAEFTLQVCALVSVAVPNLKTQSKVRTHLYLVLHLYLDMTEPAQEWNQLGC